MSGLSSAAIGIEVSRQLVSLNADLLFGVDTTVAYQDFGEGYEGVEIETLARLFGGAKHAGSVGIGPSLRWARVYGPVVFASFEIAYEYRRVGSVGTLLGLGVDVALNSSGTATCPETGFAACWVWTEHYQAGDALLRLRFAFGANY